jgi:hypothetical protein
MNPDPMVSARFLFRLLPYALTLCLTLSCGDSSSQNSTQKPWQCWLGSRSSSGDTYCSCYQSTLKPYYGSPEIGTSCQESNETDFLCCALVSDGCTCFYAVDSTLVNAAEMNEQVCGAGAAKVQSCPPP